jgi:hypothetical protein
MRFLNRRNDDNPNQLVGIFLLILLSVIMGPNIMPRIAASISPVIDESIPCSWLRTANDLANHQSLIGRASENAIGVDLRVAQIPTGAGGTLSLDIVVINRSLGTVPIIYNPSQVDIGDFGTSGLGIIFEPGNLMARNTGRPSDSFSEQNIRLLGPRQRCIHSIDIPFNQVDPAVLSGGVQAHAYYRVGSAGTIFTANAGPTPIYNDQGLDTVAGGLARSAQVSLIGSFGAQ